MKTQLSLSKLRSIPLVIILAWIVTACATTAGIENNKTGLAHLRAARYSDAEKEFAEAANANPKNANFINNLGVAYQEQGHLDKAIDQYHKAIKLDDSKALYYRNLGNVYHTQGKLEEAMQQYKKALAINPIEVNVHSKMIDIAFDNGDIDRVVKDFEEMIKGLKPEGSRGIDQIFLPEQAILGAYGLQGKYDEVIDRATKDIDVLKGVKTEEGGYVVPIITPFFFYIQTVPKKQINVSGIMGSLYNYRGRAYLRKGNFSAAISDFKVSVQNAPGGFGTLNLGIASLETRDYREAAYQLRKFLETHPSSGIGRVYYAASLRLSGDLSSGEQELAIVRKSVGKKINLNLKSNYEYIEAVAYADHIWERFDDAIQGYNQVLLSCSSCGRSYRNLGEIYVKLQDKSKAKENLTKAAAIMPEDQRTKKMLEDLSKDTVPETENNKPSGK